MSVSRPVRTCQAAWGKLEKNGTQLYIKSYELGVMLLPSLARGALHASPTSAGPPPPPGATIVPLPYSLPPLPHGASDRIWTGSDGRMLPACLCTARADRHGRHPGDPHGGHYGAGAIGRVLALSPRTCAAAARGQARAA